MKVAASIFSWIGGVITTIIGFVTLSNGHVVTYFNYYTQTYTTQQVPYDTWVWLLWVLFIIIRVIILIWRQVAVSNGRKVACGIFTLLFCSIIGGILTLCIPQDQLDGDYGYVPTTPTYVPPVKPADLAETLSEQEKADLIVKYKKMLDDGIITQEEFERKKKDLLK